MAGHEKETNTYRETVSEFGFKSELERFKAISVLEQIRDSGSGNGNLTIDQVLHIIELDGIASDLSKTPAMPSKDILKPEDNPRMLGNPNPTDPEPEIHLTQEPTITTAPSEIDIKVEKRRTLRPSKVHTPVVFKDSRHISRPPVPEMGSGPIARNVPPPPVRLPDSKE